MPLLVAPQPKKSFWDRFSRSAAIRAILVACLVGLVSFAATEFMHSLLAPDIGGRWERWLAEGVSAIVVALLTAQLIHAANQRREAAQLRMQVISEMNHHIRNALAAISLSADSIENQQCMRVISDSVDRIEWSLREILPRRTPLPDEATIRHYFARPWPLRQSGDQMQSNGDSLQSHRRNPDECHQSSLR
jgi:signal transduction histidine kinase